MPFFLSEPDKTVHKLTPKSFSSKENFEQVYSQSFPVMMNWINTAYIDKEKISKMLKDAGVVFAKQKGNNNPLNDNFPKLIKAFVSRLSEKNVGISINTLCLIHRLMLEDKTFQFSNYLAYFDELLFDFKYPSHKNPQKSSQEFFEHYFDFLHLRVAVHQTLGKCVDDVKRPAEVAIGMKHDLPVVVEEFTKLIIRLADCRPITEGEADESGKCILKKKDVLTAADINMQMACRNIYLDAGYILRGIHFSFVYIFEKFYDSDLESVQKTLELFETYFTKAIPLLNRLVTQFGCFMEVKSVPQPKPDVLALIKLQRDALAEGKQLYESRQDRPQIGPLCVIYPDRTIDKKVSKQIAQKAEKTSKEAEKEAKEESSPKDEKTKIDVEKMLNEKSEKEKGDHKEAEDDIFAVFDTVSKSSTPNCRRSIHEDTEEIMTVFDNVTENVDMNKVCPEFLDALPNQTIGNSYAIAAANAEKMERGDIPKRTSDVFTNVEKPSSNCIDPDSFDWNVNESTGNEQEDTDKKTEQKRNSIPKVLEECNINETIGKSVKRTKRKEKSESTEPKQDESGAALQNLEPHLLECNPNETTGKSARRVKRKEKNYKEESNKDLEQHIVETDEKQNQEENGQASLNLEPHLLECNPNETTGKSARRVKRKEKKESVEQASEAEQHEQEFDEQNQENVQLQSSIEPHLLECNPNETTGKSARRVKRKEKKANTETQ